MPRYPGGLIRKTPVTPAGPLQNGAASGVWSLADAAYWTKQGLWPIAGNFLAVEDVFSTWLYTGNGSTQTITNGIDLSGEGGMVWIKDRVSTYATNVVDTARGSNKVLFTALTNAETTDANRISSFSSTGFSLGSNLGVNKSGDTYASWTFREAPNFFDVVTYTGNGTSQTISHNLGVTPGCIIVKRTDDVANWAVWHRGFSNPATGYAWLNLTDAASTSASVWNNTAPTSTGFSVGGATATNGPGYTYVAYLYAHDATSDGIIQCGSYTGNGSATGPVVTLGWEPQWVIVKRSDTAGVGWYITDTMRGMPVGSADALLTANTADAEVSGQNIDPTATGFQLASTGTAYNASGGTYVYIAIRRGPMRTPTLGTSVFSPDFFGGGTVYYNSGFPTDLALTATRAGDTYNTSVADRLRGGNNTLVTSNANAELADPANYFDNMVGYGLPYTGGTSTATIGWLFRRAPSFFDEVCYTGNGSTQALTHNLGVAPELIIVKSRSVGTSWTVYSSGIAAGNYMFLNQTNASAGPNTTLWGNNSAAVAPTSTAFTVGSYVGLNQSGGTYVAYLFASCAGVSKVGSYTGNGSSQTINCAFTTGSRFVMIKRTNAAGDWYVWDSARGIVAGNDPYLALNTTAAEVTSNDSVDTDNTGFIVNQVAASNINVNAASYIFLAIA